MRQAGRYLPEYRELRSYAGSFLDLVYDSGKAAEVTVQPLRRFGMDAAILFSDILIVPHALGQSVRFETGEGPVLDALYSEIDFKKLSVASVDNHCAPIYETVRLTREKMAEEGFDETALIGFCGSPWTVACYMIEGGGSRDFQTTRRWALNDPASFQKLMDILIEASVIYLEGQVRAGAEVVQLFDSWGGLLDEDQFTRWIVEPTKTIVARLKKNFPHVPVIGFPRGAGVLMKSYAQTTGINGIGIDQTIGLDWAAANLQDSVAVQGNLDPVRLLAGGKALEEGLATIHDKLSGKPFILNLGHGVIKETPVEHVEQLAKIVKGWKA